MKRFYAIAFLAPALATCQLHFSGRVHAQSQQNPSPMVEHVRPHPRLERKDPRGQRVKLSQGQLFIPEKLKNDASAGETPLLIAFHCGNWIPEMAASQLKAPLPCLSLQLGSGSGRYATPFTDDPKLLEKLLAEVAGHLNRPISSLVLVGWSAGYGSIREMIRIPEYEAKVSHILLIDGLHTGYIGGKPGPLESKIETEPLMPFLHYARKAAESKKAMIILHSEIFPGTFASTTETADWLIRELQLRRNATLKWGPMKTQQLGETVAGKLQIRAFAGNSAPDHVDLLHGLPEFLPELLAP
ncbi:MAG: hypothetical protein ACKO85_15885 [Isosphaeraceae bacterium]